MADDTTVDDGSTGDNSQATIAQLIQALQASKPAQGAPRIPQNTVNGQPLPQQGPQGALPGAAPQPGQPQPAQAGPNMLGPNGMPSISGGAQANIPSGLSPGPDQPG